MSRPTSEQLIVVCHSCIKYLNDRFLYEKGLFRTPASLTDVRLLQTQMYQGAMNRVRGESDPHIVTGILTKSLKEMEFSVLHEAYCDIVATDITEDAAACRNAVSLWLIKLPRDRFELARDLLALLQRIANVGGNDANAMQLAFYVAPYICRPVQSAFMSIRHMEDLRCIRPVLAFLIDHQQEIFTKDLQPLRDTMADQPPPLPAITTATSSSSSSGSFSSSKMPPSALPNTSNSNSLTSMAAAGALQLLSISTAAANSSNNSNSSNDDASPKTPDSPQSPTSQSILSGSASGSSNGTNGTGGDSASLFQGHPTVTTGKPRGPGGSGGGLNVNVHIGSAGNSGGDSLYAYDYPPSAMGGEDGGDELGFPYVQSTDSSNPPVNFRSWEWKLLESLLHSRVDGFVQGGETALLGMVGQWDHSHPAPDIGDDDEGGHPQKMWKHHRYDDANVAAKRILKDDDVEEVVSDALSGLTGIGSGSDPSAMAISSDAAPSESGSAPTGASGADLLAGVGAGARPGTPAMGAWGASTSSSTIANHQGTSSSYQQQSQAGGRSRRVPGVPMPGTSFNGDADSFATTTRKVRGERRKMVAECKGLRAQIFSFEDDWTRKHGRAPKGSERGPMQPVYTRYREMKKEIRDSAAADVQRCARGYLVRRRLSAFAGAIFRGGAAGGGGGGEGVQQGFLVGEVGTDAASRGATQRNSKRNQQTSQQQQQQQPQRRGSSEMEVSDYDAEIDQQEDVSDTRGIIVLPRKLGNNVPSKGFGALSLRDGLAVAGNDAGGRRSSTSAATQGNAAAATSSAAVGGGSGGQSTVSGTTIPTEMYSKYRQLLSQKKDLKKELKKFDEEFQAKHGREPRKSDKEVMRPLYQRYHEVKADLDALQAAIEASHGPMGDLADDGEGNTTVIIGGGGSSQGSSSTPAAAGGGGAGSSSLGDGKKSAAAIAAAAAGRHRSKGDKDDSRDGDSSDFVSGDEGQSSISSQASLGGLRGSFLDSGSTSGGGGSGSGNGNGVKPAHPSTPSSAAATSTGTGTGPGANTPISTAYAWPSSPAPAPTTATAGIVGVAAATSAAASASGLGGIKGVPTAADLERLQEEKRNLHAYLKAYERDFNRTHGRPVMRHEDIQPVAHEYQRYKELKVLVKDLQYKGLQ